MTLSLSDGPGQYGTVLKLYSLAGIEAFPPPLKYGGGGSSSLNGGEMFALA